MHNDDVFAVHDACSSIALEEIPDVIPSFQSQIEEPFALTYVMEMIEAPKHPRSTKSSHARTSLRSGSMTKGCLEGNDRPCSSPVQKAEGHSSIDRPLSSSGEKSSATGVRKSKRSVIAVPKKADEKLDCALPKSTSSSRRLRKSESFAAFRIDSSDRHGETRESSLARGYDALGVEFHSLDDGADAELPHFGSTAGVHPGSSVPRLSFGTRSERRANAGQGHVPFAAVMEQSAPKAGLRGSAGSRSISVSAMSMDLTDDAPAMQTTIRKPMSSSQRSTSMGAVRVSIPHLFQWSFLLNLQDCCPHYQANTGPLIHLHGAWARQKTSGAVLGRFSDVEHTHAASQNLSEHRN